MAEIGGVTRILAEVPLLAKYKKKGAFLIDHTDKKTADSCSKNHNLAWHTVYCEIPN